MAKTYTQQRWKTFCISCPRSLTSDQVPDDRWGTGLAVVVVKPNEELSADDVIGYCLKQLAKFKAASIVLMRCRAMVPASFEATLRDQYVDASQPAIT